MFAHLNPHSSDFWYPCALYSPCLRQLTMQSSLFEPGCPVLVVVCVARKLHPCPSYSRRRDRINLGLWRSLYKGGGYARSRPAEGFINDMFLATALCVPCDPSLRVALQGGNGGPSLVGHPNGSPIALCPPEIAPEPYFQAPVAAFAATLETCPPPSSAGLPPPTPSVHFAPTHVYCVCL